MPLVNHASRDHSFINGGGRILEKNSHSTLWELNDDAAEASVTERLRSINFQLETLHQKYDTKTEDILEKDAVQKEWRAVAAILDKIFMICFFAVAMIVFAQGFATSL